MPDLHQGSVVGQYGVEKFYRPDVRGQAGQKSVEVDAFGHEKKAAVVERAQAGDDLYLTIDVRLQKVAEDLLGQESGAIVALDPTNGDILAMASRPGFDPNVLSRELTPKQWVEIVQDEGRPLNNRASQGQYPPGSTFKVLMAAAALESHTMSPSQHRPCNGGYQFGRRLYHDWKAGGHGAMDLAQCADPFVRRVFLYSRTADGHRYHGLICPAVRSGRRNGIELPSERIGHYALDGMEAEGER